MSAIGTAVTAIFGADTAPLAGKSAEAGGMVDKFASRANAALSALGLTLGAGAILGFFKTVVDRSGALQDLSDRLEVSTDELQSFDFAVRLAGGTTEQATSAWDKARKALDMLAAGQDVSVKQFAALGLKAGDFIGLNLPEKLELIARGYAENATRAGAYDAVTDILGSKTAPKLNVALLQLAQDGFPAFNAAARTAGQIVEKEAIARLDEFGDRIATLKGTLSTWGASVADAVLKAGQGIGALSATAVNAVSGLRTDFAAFQKNAEAAGKAVETILPPLVETTVQLKQQKELSEARQRASEFILRDEKDQADTAARLVLLKKEAQAAAERFAATQPGTIEHEKELLAVAQRFSEISKLERQEKERHAAATRLAREDEDKFAQLSLRSAEKLTAEERVQLQIYGLKRAELENEFKIKTHLAKGSENLSAAEKIVLADLFKQRTKLDEQLAAKHALIASTQLQQQEEQKVTDELNEQLTIQVAQKYGRDDKALSDRELAEKRTNIKRDLTASQQNRDSGLEFFYQQKLGEVDFEINRRSEFRRAYSREGEKALTRYSAFDEQTLRNYIRPEDEKRAQETLAALQSIEHRLRRIIPNP